MIEFASLLWRWLARDINAKRRNRMGCHNNGWAKREIDRMEMMHILGLIYAKTSVGFGRIGLCRFIRKEAKPTIQGKYTFVARAIIKTELLTYTGSQGVDRLYRWNFKKYGPISLLIADMIIQETENQVRESARKKYNKKRQEMKLEK